MQYVTLVYGRQRMTVLAEHAAQIQAQAPWLAVRSGEHDRATDPKAGREPRFCLIRGELDRVALPARA
jgi:hypothetical protein